MMGEGDARGGIFRLRKWYFDFLSPGLDYGFAFFADVAFGGLARRTVTLHLARAGEKAPVTAHIPIPHFQVGEGGYAFTGGEMTFREGRDTIEARGSGCAVELAYTSPPQPDTLPVVIGNGGRGEIRWKPLRVKSRVSGSIHIGGERLDIRECNGYVDYLESSCLPPLVPVRTLAWGRLHDPSLDLVFVRAAGGPGNGAWSRLTIHSAESVTECSEVRMVSAAVSDGYGVEASFGSRRLRMHVRHAAAVQNGGFIDPRLVKSAAVRYVVRKVTRDPRSTKWLSYADGVFEAGGRRTEFRDVAMIDEFALL